MNMKGLHSERNFLLARLLGLIFFASPLFEAHMGSRH